MGKWVLALLECIFVVGVLTLIMSACGPRKCPDDTMRHCKRVDGRLVCFCQEAP